MCEDDRVESGVRQSQSRWLGHSPTSETGMKVTVEASTRKDL
jgi:hypothetical protein